MKVLFLILLFFVFFRSHAQIDTLEISAMESANSNFNDYNPVFVDSLTLLFTSTRPNIKTENILRESENIYISKKVSGQWSQSKPFGYLFDSDNHDAVAGISHEKSKLFIYKIFNGGDIYFSNVKNGGYSGPKRAPFNTPYCESNAVQINNKVYFISDMPGGKGMRDIWFSEMDDNFTWSKSQNLEILNSEKNENTLYISSDGKRLYFCSQGHDSYGGYDIFYSQFNENGQWGEPKNLGNFINTEHNETGYSIDNVNLIYFSSDRPLDSRNDYNIYCLKEKKIRKTVPLVKIGTSPIEDDETGEVFLIKESVEIEGYNRNIPLVIKVNVSKLKDSTQVIKTGDLINNPDIVLAESADIPVTRVKINPKINPVIEPINNLEEIKKEIPFQVKYCKVQVGAFTTIKELSAFAKQYPLLGDKVIMIKNEKLNRFLMRETFESIDEAAILQKKCILEYNSVRDAFIAVYDGVGKRVLIYFDVNKEKFILLNPETQENGDIF